MNRPLSPEEMIAIREAIQSGPLKGLFNKQSILTGVHSDIVHNEKLEDFETVWETGRLLHNADKPEDAKFYLKKAVELQPENPKARGRLIELYLDLHEEMPNRGFNRLAHQEAQTLSKLEDSEFARSLLAEATGYVGLRSLHDGIQQDLG